MKKPNKRLYYLINGLLQIVDGITCVATSMFNKPGTYFSYQHCMFDLKKELNYRDKR